MRKHTRKVVRCDADRSPISPLQVYVAVTLFAILAICEIDRHRDLIAQIGTMINNEGLDTPFVGP
jgi:hypothetical protein